MIGLCRWDGQKNFPAARTIREERMAAHHALVTGAHGIVGLNLVQELAARSDWKVTATGRRGSLPVSVDYISADLQDAQGLRSALAAFGHVTQLIFCPVRSD